jgi:hypothetical protein
MNAMHECFIVCPGRIRSQCPVAIEMYEERICDSVVTTIRNVCCGSSARPAQDDVPGLRLVVERVGLARRIARFERCKRSRLVEVGM